MQTKLDKQRKLIGKALRYTEEAGWYSTNDEKKYLLQELIRRLNLQD